MRKPVLLFIAVGLLLAALGARADAELLPPVALEAADGPIDVAVGHAAPFLHDLDGDGLRDLLVGQFGEGRLRVYRNVGTAEAPRYEAFRFLEAGEAEATVPSG